MNARPGGRGTGDAGVPGVRTHPCVQASPPPSPAPPARAFPSAGCTLKMHPEPSGNPALPPGQARVAGRSPTSRAGLGCDCRSSCPAAARPGGMGSLGPPEGLPLLPAGGGAGTWSHPLPLLPGAPSLLCPRGSLLPGTPVPPGPLLSPHPRAPCTEGRSEPIGQTPPGGALTPGSGRSSLPAGTPRRLRTQQASAPARPTGRRLEEAAPGLGGTSRRRGPLL